MTRKQTRRTVEIRLVAGGSLEEQPLRQAFAATRSLRLLDSIGNADAVLAWVEDPNRHSQLACADLLLIEWANREAHALCSGRELLRRIKSQPRLRGIPVIVLADSWPVENPASDEAHHACSLIVKPTNVPALRRLARQLEGYWGTVAQLPKRTQAAGDASAEAEPALEEVFELDLDSMGDSSVPKALGKPLEILVVDDNDDDAVLFQESLAECEGLKVVQILHDGDSALDYLRKRPPFEAAPSPGLVVMDIHMPRKPGLKVLEEIKADPLLRPFPVVMLSASRHEDDVWESYSRGACAFIEKPPRFERFREIAQRFADYWAFVAPFPKP